MVNTSFRACSLRESGMISCEWSHYNTKCNYFIRTRFEQKLVPVNGSRGLQLGWKLISEFVFILCTVEELNITVFIETKFYSAHEGSSCKTCSICILLSDLFRDVGNLYVALILNWGHMLLASFITFTFYYPLYT